MTRFTVDNSVSVHILVDEIRRSTEQARTPSPTLHLDRSLRVPGELFYDLEARRSDGRLGRREEQHTLGC